MGILGATYVDHNPDSWEGWHWGAMHVWGYAWRLGIAEQYDLLEDALKNTEMVVYWSSDPDGEPMIYTGQESTPWRFWLKELGVPRSLSTLIITIPPLTMPINGLLPARAPTPP